jgi:hypothetical protein
MFFVEDKSGALVAVRSTFDAACDRAIAEVQSDIAKDPGIGRLPEALPSYSVSQGLAGEHPMPGEVAPRRTICIMQQVRGPFRGPNDHGMTVRCVQYAEPTVDAAALAHFSLIDWTNTVRAERDAAWAAATGWATPSEAKEELGELYAQRNALLEAAVKEATS